MSSFIVDDKTINGIVTYLYHDRDAGYLRDQLTRAGIATRPQDLGEAMYRLNLAAVEDRYGDYAAGQMCTLEYKYRPVIASKVQVIKSLSCWLYQCAEGTIDEDPLYKLMEKYQADCAMDIVRAQPEWDTANWG